MESKPKISIVVLTYNSEKTIGFCLDALMGLDYPEDLLEIVVLDNGSKDTTLKTIELYGLRYHILPDLNLSELRNYGAKISAGNIVAYIDSDCVVASDWLNQAVKWFEDPLVGIVGNEYLLPENATLFERNWYNRSNYGVKYDDLIPAGNMALRKDYFHRLGGFDKSLFTGEDDYIVGIFRQAGYLTVSDSQISSIHLGNAKNLRQYFHKESWYGLGMLGTLHLSKQDKPLIATLLFFLCISASLGLFMLALYLEKNILFASGGVALLCAILILILSTVDRIYRKKRKGNFLYVMLVYLLFFCARLKALVMLANSGGSRERE